MYCVDSLNRNTRSLYFLTAPSPRQDAPLIVLLHGFPDSAFGWDLQLDALKSNFQVVAPFLPGTLNGADATTEHVSLAECADDVVALVAAVRKEGQKVYLVSHDIGCFIAVEALRRGLSPLAGLVHLNGMGLDQFAGRIFSLGQWFKSYYVLLAQIPFVRDLVGRRFPQFFLNYIYDRSQVPSADEIRTQTDRRVFSCMTIYRNLLRRAAQLVGKKIQKIELPTLFIWGNNDAFLESPSEDEVRRHYTHATFRTLNQGHWVLRSNPRQVNRLIIGAITSWELGHE